MIKAYEIIKEKKLVIDCKNGDFIQFGKHLHIICDDGTYKDETNTMDLETGLFYLIPNFAYVNMVKYKEVQTMTKQEFLNFIDIELKEQYKVTKKEVENSGDISYKIYFKKRNMFIPVINIKINPVRIYINYYFTAVENKDYCLKQSETMVYANEIGYKIAYNTLTTYIDLIISN